MTTGKKKRIVIVGAGFGGVFAYLELHKRLHGRSDIVITVINPIDRFVFIPMIHEVATGTLQPSSVTQAIRTLPQCCIDDFVEGRVTSADFDNRILSVEVTADGNSRVTELSYDYIVLGMGSQTNFFDIPGAKENSLELKSLEDAVRIKNRVVDMFERAQTLNDSHAQKVALTFVVVGGGATGVEIAGELSDLVSRELTMAFPEFTGVPQVIIVDQESQFLKMMDPWFGGMVSQILEAKPATEVRHNTTVRQVTTDGVKTDSGFISAGTVVWVGGVKARNLTITAEKEIPKDKTTERIKVENTLQVSGYSEVFVTGDQAWICNKETGQPYPMRAQFAQREGKIAGRNIASMLSGSPLKEFDWKEKGFIVSLGKGGALAQVFGVRFSGILAWFVYRVAYLISMVGWRAKVRTGLEWSMNILLPRDVSKL